MTVVIVACAAPRLPRPLLGGRPRRSRDGALRRRRAGAAAVDGFAGPEDDPTVLVEAGPDRLRFFFQLVPEPRTVKNRLHLDLCADDPAAEIARLVGLGASVTAWRATLTNLRDPEGNEFCVLH